MRVITGKLGGRVFQAPGGHCTHPMGDKIRGALFNVFGDIEGLTILDAFAGSGALSLEAVSRGAKSVVAIEVDKNAYNVILKNVHDLKLDEQIKVIRANAGSWSDNNPDIQFDIVLLDPPHDDIKPSLLEKLANHTNNGGVMVLSLPPNFSIHLSTNYQLLSTKQYGDAKLEFYRKALM